MFERFTGDARAVVIEAQHHARRLGHPYIGCEHLLLAAASTGEPASAALRELGVTPAAVEAEIVRLFGVGRIGGVFAAADRQALASIGIDLDAVLARIEATFGLDAFVRAGSPVCCRNRFAPRIKRAALLRRSHRRRNQQATDDGHRTGQGGHIPFTPRAKRSLECSLREAKARQDAHIGVEHLSLALIGMDKGAVPPILLAIGASQTALRAAILDRYRKAS